MQRLRAAAEAHDASTCTGSCAHNKPARMPIHLYDDFGILALHVMMLHTVPDPQLSTARPGSSVIRSAGMHPAASPPVATRECQTRHGPPSKFQRRKKLVAMSQTTDDTYSVRTRQPRGHAAGVRWLHGSIRPRSRLHPLMIRTIHAARHPGSRGVAWRRAAYAT